jgi:undecaprenyl-diphosphatase
VNTKLSKTQKQLALISAVFLLSFLILTFLRGFLSATDLSINLWVQSIHSSPFTFVAEGIAFVFDFISLLVITVVIAAILFFKNHRPESLLLLGAMGGDALLVSFAKGIFQSPRPLDALISDSGFSYPSGHTIGSLVFCGILAFLAWQHWKSPRAKVSVGVGVAVVVSLVGFSRVYLGVHWFSDILGAVLLGVFWLTFVVLVFKVLGDLGKFKSARVHVILGILFCLAVVVAVVDVVARLLG